MHNSLVDVNNELIKYYYSFIVIIIILYLHFAIFYVSLSVSVYVHCIQHVIQNPGLNIAVIEIDEENILIYTYL